MPWTTAVSDLRTLLSDGAQDRYNFRKRCFGEINGTNVRFKTFDFRRITDFTSSVEPLGVYIDGELQNTSAIASDVPVTGDFVLADAPLDGSIVEASYYIQWFLDSELVEFLQTSGLWIQSSSDYTLLSGGLIPVALKYAASEGYLKLSQRWRNFMSDGYKVEDSPQTKPNSLAESFSKMSEAYRKQAESSLEMFYKRQKRPLQPLFGSVQGRIRPFP